LTRRVFNLNLSNKELGFIVCKYDTLGSGRIVCKPFINDFLKWGNEARYEHHIQQLEKQRRLIEESEREHVEKMQKVIEAQSSDLFDVLAYVAFALAPQTRAQRAAMAKTEVHQKFTDRQQAFVDFVLAQYVKEGVEELDAEKLTPLLRLRYNNAIADAVADLGSADQIRRVFVGFQKYLYEARPN
jgi:hypothetical protein